MYKPTCMNTITQEIEVVRDRDRAEVLLHPLRLGIMEAAREPGSAAELARRLGQKPQKINYHVQRLVEHGFLRLAEERRAGNVVEKVYAATAESYVLASDVLGGLSPGDLETDPGTAARLLALQARAEAELGEVMRDPAANGRPIPTVTLDAEFRFETAEQRALFARSVRELFGAIVSKYTSPALTGSGDPGLGRPYRLMLGCYPIPGEGEEGTTESSEERGDSGERQAD